MRLALPALIGCALLAGCEPATPRPSAAATPSASARPEAAIPADPAELDREAAWEALNARTADTPQARGQAEAAMRDLDTRASSLGAEIAGVRNGAEAARRAAVPPEPPEPAVPAPPNATAPAPAPAAARAAPPPTPPAATPVPPAG